MDLTGDTETISNGPLNVVDNSNINMSWKNALATVIDDKSTDINMNGSNDGLRDVPASTKPAIGGVNAASNQVVIQATVIDMSGQEGEKDTLVFTNSGSNKDGTVQGGDVVMGGVLSSPKPVQNVGFSDGDDMSLVGKAVNHLANNTALNAG